MQPIKNPLGRVFIHLSIWVFVLYNSVPFVWTFLQSLKTKKQANSRTPLFWFEPTFEQYSELWLEKVPENFSVLVYTLIAILITLFLFSVIGKKLSISSVAIRLIILGTIVLMLLSIPLFVKTAEFYDYFVNTMIVAIGTVIISIGIASLSGYALSRYLGIAGVILIILALAFRSLPRMAFGLPYFWMGQISGLYDSNFLVIIALAAVNQPFAIYMLRSFFKDIPREIEEAAMVDGASRFEAFIKVIVPIMWPGIITTSLFTLVLVYHEFLLVRILTLKNWTLAVAMQQYLGGISDSGSLPLKSAAAVSAALPLLVVILFYQKHLIKGITAGSVKG
ncbi:MAG: carbohydrate ABC transporter permease [Candidatus Nitrosopelagicus sp.]|jgi:multiple sugar transport system permease protein|nr:carbohydrate ABC transporter permease [Candidatus Nitrosopelagicus sp.]|tara:strand:+ start:298 stop:1305 length:1008 start_codon:yes stop_codon:yes gene_type:complete